MTNTRPDDPHSTRTPPPLFEPTLMVWLDLSKLGSEPVRVRTTIKKNRSPR